MRWVFFSILILNVVYFLWKLVVAVAVVPAPAVAGANVSLAPEPLVLLAEVADRVPAGQIDARAVPALCPAVGPWGGLAEADQVMRTLAGKGYAGKVRPVRVMKDRLFWVFLPAYEAREQALKVLRELQAQDVDSFVVAEGEDRNAISLGYFSSSDSARGLSVKMQNEGYPAEVRETAREVTEYWLVFRKGGIPDDGAALRALAAGRDGLVSEDVACEAVSALRARASEADAPAPASPAAPEAAEEAPGTEEVSTPD